MKKAFLFSVSTLVLAGCGAAKDTNWSDNCKKHHSETGREFQQCMEKLKRKKAERVHAQERLEKGTAEVPPARVEDREIPGGVVTVDPEGGDMESFGREQGKKSRGTVSTPTEME
jgi:hypothetical protein